MIIPKKVKDIFNNEPVHQLATSSKNGVPNVCNAGAKYLFNDETIIIIDNYMDKTLANILENPFSRDSCEKRQGVLSNQRQVQLFKFRASIRRRQKMDEIGWGKVSCQGSAQNRNRRNLQCEQRFWRGRKNRIGKWKI
jgi:predicted pyridoxine 5'-phosphate oxidase superfamily flavin-nucleotide-binding protein